MLKDGRILYHSAELNSLKIIRTRFQPETEPDLKEYIKDDFKQELKEYIKDDFKQDLKKKHELSK